MIEKFFIVIISAILASMAAPIFGFTTYECVSLALLVLLVYMVEVIYNAVRKS